MKLESDILVMDLTVKIENENFREVAEKSMQTFFEMTSTCLQMPHPLGMTLLSAYIADLNNLSRNVLHEIQRMQLDGAPTSEQVN